MERAPTAGRFWFAQASDRPTFYFGAFLPIAEAREGYRVVGIATRDVNTFAVDDTSQDYSGSLDSLAELVPCGGTCTTPR